MMDAVADLEFRIAEEVSILLTGQEASEAKSFVIKGVLEPLIKELSLSFLGIGQGTFVHGAASWQRANFGFVSEQRTLWQIFHLLSRRLPCRVAFLLFCLQPDRDVRN